MRYKLIRIEIAGYGKSFSFWRGLFFNQMFTIVLIIDIILARS